MDYWEQVMHWKCEVWSIFYGLKITEISTKKTVQRFLSRLIIDKNNVVVFSFTFKKLSFYKNIVCCNIHIFQTDQRPVLEQLFVAYTNICPG